MYKLIDNCNVNHYIGSKNHIKIRMLGKYHVLIAFALAGSLVFKLFNYHTDIEIVMILLLGIVAGSLLPDALDASNSAMNYKRMRGKEMRYFELFTVVNPLIASVSRILAYPLKYILEKSYSDINFGHRGVWHSFLGAGLISTAWFMPTAVFIFGCEYLMPEMHMLIWFALPFGIFTGYILHLVEDSFTVTGINWLYPKGKFHVSGKIKTVNEYSQKYKKLSLRQKNRIIFYYFAITTVGMFFLIQNVILYVLGLMVITGFAAPLFGVRIDRGKSKKENK